MSKPYRVSQSKAKTWRKCHQAYHFKYVEKLRRKKIKRPFMFGRIVHSMLEAYDNGDDPYEVLGLIEIKNRKMFAAEREMYGEILKDIELIMREYFDFWPEDHLRALRINKSYSEHPFEVEIANGIVATGKIDAICTTKNKLKWLTERKTFTRLPNEDHRWRNLQSALYLRIIQDLGWLKNVDGVAWDYIRSKPPTLPKMLDSGKLSEKKIDTLPSIVKAMCKEHGLKVRDHEKLLQHAINAQNEYFFRVFTPINKRVVDRVYSDFVKTAKEMASQHGERCEKNIDRHCDYCDFEPLCRAELTGSDVDFVKEREYTKEKEEDLYEKEDSNE